MTAGTSATYHCPDNVAWVDGSEWGMGDELYLTFVPDGETVMLDGTARLIWLVAIEQGSVTDEIARLVGQSLSDIGPDVQRFVEELVAEGLLAQTQQAC